MSDDSRLLSRLMFLCITHSVTTIWLTQAYPQFVTDYTQIRSEEGVIKTLGEWGYT